MNPGLKKLAAQVGEVLDKVANGEMDLNQARLILSGQKCLIQILALDQNIGYGRDGE